MTTRKKRAQEARELAAITPVNAFASLKGNLYPTQAQNASAKNFLPRKPRKPKKRKKKRRIKGEEKDVKVEETTIEEIFSPQKPPPPLSSAKIYEVDSDLTDSSFDTDYEKELYEYDVKMESYNDEKKECLKTSKAIKDGRKYAKGSILAQCTREMREKLTTKDTFQDITTNTDIVALAH